MDDVAGASLAIRSIARWSKLNLTLPAMSFSFAVEGLRSSIAELAFDAVLVPLDPQRRSAVAPCLDREHLLGGVLTLGQLRSTAGQG